MRSVGNERAEEIYGGDGDRPHDNASDEVWRHFIVNKYYHRKFSSSSRKIMIAETRKAPNTFSNVKESGIQSFNSPVSGAVKHQKSKVSRKIIATRLPPSSNVPVFDLLGFDAEAEPRARSVVLQAGDVDDSSRATKMELRNDSNEAFPTEQVESSDDFFAEFGL
jgi:hypothetical protein